MLLPHLLPQHPQSAGPRSDLYPTVWLLDPFGTFTTAAGIATTTTLLALGHLRPVAIIGVGPRGTDLGAVTAQRMLDLTPTPSVLPHVTATAPLGTGGAQVVLDLLVQELAPRLEARFPFDPADRTIAGWSLGGLFSCHALMQCPEHFHQVLAVSPSLWWNDGELIDSPSDLTGKRMYLAAGEHERPGRQGWPLVPEEAAHVVEAYPIDMVDDLERFSVNARKAGADVRTEVLAGEQHITIWGAAFTRGLVHLFKD
jgi:predicted alpha/beta superfamily hydrolase